eukprot:527631_1
MPTTQIEIQQATLYQGLMTILCALGSLLSVITCITLLVHILYHSKNNDTKSKSKSRNNSNRMVVAYLITAIIACSIYGFIRSNVFTRITVSNFSRYQCAFGYFSGFLLAGINRICLYFLFLYRIKSVFEGSAYAYSSTTFTTITIIIIAIYTFITLIAIWMFLQNTNFDLYISDHTGFTFIWCGHHNDTNGYLKWILIAWYIVIIIGEFTINIMFLAMFVKGLYGLQQSIIVTHKSLQNVLDLEEDETICNDDDRPKEKLSVNNSLFASRKGSIGFHEMMVKYSKQNSNVSGQKPQMHASIEMMIKLHHLTKKTTILVAVAIVSSLFYWILSAVDGWYSILVAWDIMINAICSWLLLKTSMKYWSCFSKYGCCRLCYKKLDEQLL